MLFWFGQRDIKVILTENSGHIVEKVVYKPERLFQRVCQTDRGKQQPQAVGLQ